MITLPGKLLRRTSLLVELLGTRQGLASLPADLRSSPTLRRINTVGAPPMWARLGRRESDLRTLRQVWCTEPYVLPPDPDVRWILDAGANVGYATKWFADRFPNATVIAIEPDAQNVAMIRRNTIGLENVRVVHAALAAVTGTTVVVDPGQGSWGLRAGDHAQGQGVVVSEVECVTISQLLEQFDMKCIDILKIDIEGAELDVLTDAAEWIHLVKTMIVELHDRFRPGCLDAWVKAVSDFDHHVVGGENYYSLRQ